MAIVPAYRVPRPRQRSRSGLFPFTDPLSPALSEVGIDRVVIRAVGRWEATDSDFTPDDYRQNLATADPELGWFNNPTSSADRFEIETMGQPPGLIRHAYVRVDGFQRRGGSITIKLTANPTRTLAHRLAELGSHDFLERAINMPVARFFMRHDDVARTFNEADNWLPDLLLARDACGEAIFDTFLPVFATQLRGLAIRLVMPTLSAAVRDGADATVASVDGCAVSIDWTRVRVPEIEAYFERHHSSATSVMQRAADAALTSLDRARVWSYLPSPSFHRTFDLLSINADLAKPKRLAIYAKAADRLRFEVRRGAGGRFGQISNQHPAGRLFQAMNAARTDVLGADWGDVAKLFVEPPVATLADLLRLVDRVVVGSGVPPERSNEILKRLIEDGGLTAYSDAIAAVRALQDVNVLERIDCRARDHSEPRRYVLTAQYRAVRNALFVAFGRDAARRR